MCLLWRDHIKMPARFYVLFRLQKEGRGNGESHFGGAVFFDKDNTIANSGEKRNACINPVKLLLQDKSVTPAAEGGTYDNSETFHFVPKNDICWHVVRKRSFSSRLLCRPSIRIKQLTRFEQKQRFHVACI